MDQIKVLITKTIAPPRSKETFSVTSIDAWVYVTIGASLFGLLLISIIAISIHKNKSLLQSKWNETRQRLSDKNNLKSGLNEFFTKNFGIRFKQWSVKDVKLIREDVIQNVMILSNGILAIVFAIEWKSDNNPLLIINNKFKTGT